MVANMFLVEVFAKKKLISYFYLASSIMLLNGFVKKSTKDYDKEITKAINI